jgi:hypothetical protein
VFNDGGANYDFRIEGDTNAICCLFFVDASAEAVGIGTRVVSSAELIHQGLLVGTSTNIGSENIQIGTAHGTLGLYKFANNDDGGELTLANSRNGTVGSQTIVNNNDFLGRIFFRGSDGSAFLRGADIVCQVDGTPGTNDMPGRLVFATTASGASTPTERMRIRADGQIVCVATYDNTTASAANVHIFGDRSLGRSTSSIRYKTNVETLQDSYADSILDCRPVWYQSKCTNDNPDWGYWGFIAEEVEQVDPRLCKLQLSKPQ